MIKNKFIPLVLIGFMVILFSNFGCNLQKSEDKNAMGTENVISEELHQAQCDLLAKANENFAKINQKVRDLNDEIRNKGGKLTDAQNAALDDFEAKQASLNKRMHEIKNIRQQNWESFKTAFENDMVEMQKTIDDILESF